MPFFQYFLGRSFLVSVLLGETLNFFPRFICKCFLLLVIVCILDLSIFLLGEGRVCPMGFFTILQKRIFILLFTHDSSIFLTLDEIQFGVSDLGM